MSALEAGDVDLIDPAPATLFEQLSANPDWSWWRARARTGAAW